MDGWNTTYLLGWPIFRCYVSFREGTPRKQLMFGSDDSLPFQMVPNFRGTFVHFQGGTVDGSEIRRSPVEGGWQFTPNIYQGFFAPSKRWLGKGIYGCHQQYFKHFLFSPRTLGKIFTHFDGCIFFRWVGENPPTIPIGSMYGIYMDPMGYSSSSRLSSVTQKFRGQEADSFERNQLHRSQGWQWRGHETNRAPIGAKESNDFRFSKYEGNSVYRLIYIYVDMFI